MLKIFTHSLFITYLFLLQAKLLAKINHTSIVFFECLFTQKEREAEYIIIVMEYVEGQDLGVT